MALQKSLTPPSPAGRAALAPRTQQTHWFRTVLTPLASLKLTVAMFALAMILIFLGTLAQVDEGIFTVLSKYFRSGIAWIPFQALVRFGQVFLGLSPSAQLSGSFPFPGGWLIGGVLLVNLLAAHTVRFKLTWKRSGILILHSGLVLLMVNEFVTGLFAVEGRMTIPANGTVNFVEDHRATELAIVDHSNPTSDDVVVIPGSFLRNGALIEHQALPFDVQVVRYMPNSDEPKDMVPGKENLATAGDGLKQVVVELPEVSGTDPDQRPDMASAYVTFQKKNSGQSLGTYLVSTWWSIWWLPASEQPQQVSVDGKTYDVFLRSKRTYKPYSIHLNEFRHDRYMGTDIPKNYSSQVRLVDNSRGEDRETMIYMNHPLRYAGETFYQSSFLAGDQGTILQVVRNPGWLLPYLACAIVALGLLIHFGLHLIGFLRQRAAL
jgi:hypothetical protein